MGPDKNPRKLRPAIDRFLEKIVIAENGCWNWTGTLNSTGYGQFWYNRRPNGKACRFAYEHYREAVPEGLQLDHLCRNRICVNPYHLEAVTQKENVLRGVSPPALNAKKTHCKRGHSLSGDNLVIRQGKRNCLTCMRAVRNTPERVAKRKAFDRARWIAGNTTHQRRQIERAAARSMELAKRDGDQ
jgi:hypothetical protein